MQQYNVMSEKQFDHIENRIREAAENSEPDYDEYAWELMEDRLNKEDNKKPRFLLWALALLLVCITGGGIYWWPENGNEKFVKENEQQVADKTLPVKPNTNSVSIIPDSNLTSSGSLKTEQQQLNNSVDVVAGKQGFGTQNNNTAGSQMNQPKKLIRAVQKGRLSAKAIVPAIDTENELANITESLKVDTAEIAGRTEDLIIFSDTRKDSLQMLDKAIVKVDKDSADNKPAKKNNEKLSRFYLLAAAGADAGSVRISSFKHSGITPKYGIGIGYQVNKRLSVQTGFYASWKKYIAGPKDYNYKAGSYWTTVNMIKVDASCLVYDIPLTLRYDFIQKASTSYFATAGLSSFIMKKEEYNYHYTRNNMYYQSQKSYTGNTAFFSVFNLTAGVEKKITKEVSLLAEPSIAIPLAGVGEGSVKLYSAALQIGIKYKPAKRRK